LYFVISFLFRVWNAVISGYPQGYGPPSGGGRAFPPSLSGLAGGGNANASPGPGDLYADGSLPGYTAAAVAAAAAAAAAAGSPQLAGRVSLGLFFSSFSFRVSHYRISE
jgi:hypothetical protein